MKPTCLILFLIFITSACSTKVPVNPQFDEGSFEESSTNYVAPMGEIKPEYFDPVYDGEHILEKGDSLEISVIGEPDTYIENTPVSPDGYLYYLMSEPVYAVGMKVKDLRSKLQSNLSVYFEDVRVYAKVNVRTNNKFQILGKVNLPGEYGLELPVKLREAIVLAGGIKKGDYRLEKITLADFDKSYLIRDGKKLPVDFKKLFTLASEKENIYIRPGDYIYIASAVVEEVYVLGSVHQPMSVIYKKNLTALKLLTKSKFKDDSYLKGAVIIRKSLENPEILVVNLEKMLYGEEKDIYMEPGDILYIPEDPYKFVKQVAELALRAFIQTFASDAGLFYSRRDLYNR